MNASDRPRTWPKSLLPLVCAALAVTLIIAVGASWPDVVSRVAYAVEKGQATAAKAELADVRGLSRAFEQVTKAVTPSVVNIRSTRKVTEPMPAPFFGTPFGDDDMLRRFFGGRLPRGPRENEFFQRGAGSGVIVSREGHILTNNHVVGNADQITVTLANDREYPAKVIGADEKSDLAVVKISGAGDLMPAELGDSDEINVGEWVLALGNPFGLSHTVTAGIVSAKGRANVGIADYEDFIQTDAAINPGNSGGPLVDLTGKVVGINTAIYTRSGGYQGIGFAIPSNMARQVMQSIIEGGKVVRGFLGVTLQPLTPDMAQSFGYQGDTGVLVGDVVKGGPADQAGVEAGDIIIRFDDYETSEVNQLRNRVAATAPGTRVALEVYRDGATRDLKVDIGELPGQAGPAGGGEGGALTDELGLSLTTLTPEIARQLELEGQPRGAIVTAVTPGSAGERAGLAPQDVIISVDGRPIDSVNEFRSAVDKADLNRGVRLRVQRGDTQRFVILKR